MPDGLAAFLTERLDEAERNAGEIHTRDCQAMSPMVIWGSPSQGCGPCNCGQPERELRAITAKRALIRVAYDHAADLDNERGCGHDVAEIEAGECTGRRPDELPILRHLAAEWDDHPAYQPEWSPEPAVAP